MGVRERKGPPWKHEWCVALRRATTHPEPLERRQARAGLFPLGGDHEVGEVEVDVRQVQWVKAHVRGQGAVERLGRLQEGHGLALGRQLRRGGRRLGGCGHEGRGERGRGGQDEGDGAHGCCGWSGEKGASVGVGVGVVVMIARQCIGLTSHHMAMGVWNARRRRRVPNERALTSEEAVPAKSQGLLVDRTSITPLKRHSTNPVHSTHPSTHHPPHESTDAPQRTKRVRKGTNERRIKDPGVNEGENNQAAAAGDEHDDARRRSEEEDDGY